VWIAGRHSGQVSLGGRSLGDEPGMFVAGFEPSGTVRMLWLLDETANYSTAPMLGAGTYVHVAGGFNQILDTDPGTGTDVRMGPYGGSNFSVGLGLDGTYRNAHVSQVTTRSIHETPGSGSLIFVGDTYPPGPEPSMMAYYSDGTPAWTLGTDIGFYDVLAVSSTHFALWGVEDIRSQGPLRADERSFDPNYEFVVRRYAF
jgi:hypothetical protein